MTAPIYLPGVQTCICHRSDETDVDGLWDKIVHCYFSGAHYSFEKHRWGERRDSFFVLVRDEGRVPIIMFKGWSGGRYSPDVWEDTQAVFRPQADAGRKAKKRIHVIVAVQRKCKFYEYNFAEMEWCQSDARGVRPYRELDVIEDAEDIHQLMRNIVADVPRLIANACESKYVLPVDVRLIAIAIWQDNSCYFFLYLLYIT
jgi:hypothetical protein